MTYIFDIEEAKRYGVPESIMLANFKFWIAKNKANGDNLHDGKTWTFNSVRAYKALFPFWTEKQIRRIILSLLDQGVIQQGNYNKAGYDRTLWYSLTDETILPFGKMDIPERENALFQKGTPIPDINTDVTTVVNKENRTRAFEKPTLEAVKEYIREKGINTVDPEHFWNYYESNGWKVGRNPMKNWKACVSTWVKNENRFKQPDSHMKNAPAPGKYDRFTGRAPA